MERVRWGVLSTARIARNHVIPALQDAEHAQVTAIASRQPERAASIAGKHVLCEKPLALTASEAQSLVDGAKRYPNLKIMEAFMYRFHPQWQRARDMVMHGAVGELRTIQSFFSYSNLDPANIRNQVEHRPVPTPSARIIAGRYVERTDSQESA